MSRSPLDREMERPLGLEGRKPERSGPRFPHRPGRLAATVASLVVIAVSAVIALDDEPFRTPPPVVVSTPEPAASASPSGAEAKAGYPEADAERGGSPSIIHIEPPADDEGGGVLVIRDPSTLGQDLRVAHLPDRALIEETEIGPLPVRAPDGRRPFDVYAGSWSGARGARVALVIGGLGVSQTGTQAAIATLPSEVTLAFATGGNSLDRWTQTARREGHEIVMQVPMEPFDYPRVDPGRNTLTIGATPEENRDRLYWALSRITNYTGVMNYMGARFTASREAMMPFFGELGERGLMYLDDGSSARSLSEEMAKANGVPFAAADLVIDGERQRGAILARLDDLERTARAKGFAIGTGSAFDVTVATVAEWVNEAKRRGIEIVPVSAVAHDPEKD